MKCNENRRRIEFHRDKKAARDGGSDVGKENQQYCPVQQRVQDNEELRTDRLSYKAPPPKEKFRTRSSWIPLGNFGWPL